MKKEDKKKLFGVQKEVMKFKNKKEYVALRTLSRLSKNMFNVGLYNVRQHYFQTETYLPYKENYHVSKINENYKLMGSAGAQQTLKKVEESFKSFFGLLKTTGFKAKIPHYLGKEDFFELSYPQFKMQEDGSFNVPVSPAFKKQFGPINVRFPTNLNPKDICEIRIIPKYKAHFFEIEYVYEIKPSEVYKLDKNEALSIDLGINNFVSAIDTQGNAFLVDGKRIKSVNQWYNKENSRLQSIKDKQSYTHLTRKQISLLKKRSNILRDFLNKTTHHIIKHCLDNGFGKIVIGHNKDWKKGSNMGKQANQRFVQIPHSQLMNKIENMCKRYGIEFVRQEESYTSKASFLDNDLIPIFKELKNEKPVFSGRRVFRGLYQTVENHLINADLNGAANILRKSNHTSNMDKVARGLLEVPARIRLV